jgi:hypothetical protein
MEPAIAVEGTGGAILITRMVLVEFQTDAQLRWAGKEMGSRSCRMRTCGSPVPGDRPEMVEVVVILIQDLP